MKSIRLFLLFQFILVAFTLAQPKKTTPSGPVHPISKGTTISADSTIIKNDTSMVRYYFPKDDGLYLAFDYGYVIKTTITSLKYNTNVSDKSLLYDRRWQQVNVDSLQIVNVQPVKIFPK